MNDTCKICGATLELVPGGTRKDGTTYDDFMGCPNYRNHPKTGQRGFQKAIEPKFDNLALIMEEIVAIENLLKPVSEYFVTKLIDNVSNIFSQEDL